MAFLCRETFRTLPDGLSHDDAARVRAGHRVWRQHVDARVNQAPWYARPPRGYTVGGGGPVGREGTCGRELSEVVRAALRVNQV